MCIYKTNIILHINYISVKQKREVFCIRALRVIYGGEVFTYSKVHTSSVYNSMTFTSVCSHVAITQIKIHNISITPESSPMPLSSQEHPTPMHCR